MAAPERVVRHLRLRAPGEAAVRRILPTLEDALRCASLGDDGGRLIVVRTLALGAVSAGLSSPALSRLIETRAAAAMRQAVSPDDREAANAACVVFAGVHDARVRLSLRLLRGQTCGAWYWTLAVPEFDPRDGASGNVVRIGAAIARSAEARAALPHWLAMLVQTAGVARIVACIDEHHGHALLRIAGFALTPGGDTRRMTSTSRAAQPAQAPSSSAPPAASRENGPGVDASSSTPALAPVDAGAGSGLRRPAPTVPAWMQRLLDVAGLPQRLSRGYADDAASSSDVHRESAAPARVRPLAGSTADRAAPSPSVETAIAPIDDRTGAARSAPSPDHAARRDSFIDAPTEADVPAGTVTAWRWTDDRACPFNAPTGCGGLLFLLPVFARIGIGIGIDLGIHLGDQNDDRTRRLVEAALHLALLRVQAAADDPMWRLAPALDTRLAREAANLLIDARHRLQRAGRIGLVRLVRRPARVSLTATHVDVRFPLSACEFRVRRLGLDLDPGWLPGFGRVVGFHYGEVPP